MNTANQPDVYLLIVYGVVSGLLTGALVAAVGIYIRKYFIPWFRSLVYAGVKVEGTWHFSSDEYDRRDITMEIKQTAGSLRAVSTHILRADIDEPTADNIRTYNLNGEVQDRLVTLYGRPNNPRRTGGIVFLLEVVGDGQKLTGQAAGYSSSLEQVHARRFTGNRLE